MAHFTFHTVCYPSVSKASSEGTCPAKPSIQCQLPLVGYCKWASCTGQATSANQASNATRELTVHSLQYLSFYVDGK